MELEINTYLAQQREMAAEQTDIRRDRGKDYGWDRNQGRERRRNRSRPSRFDNTNEIPLQGQPRRNYEANVETSNLNYRDQEPYQNNRRLEQHNEVYENQRTEDRYDMERHDDAKKYPRSDDRYCGDSSSNSSRYDDRHTDRYDERYEERCGEQRRGGDRHDDRNGGARRSGGERRGDRMDTDDRHREGRDRGPPLGKEKPSRTVMLKNLHNSITDRDIRTVLQMFGAPIKDVRLVKHRDTGVSRGFAFVEFQFLPDAQRWMEENQGHIDLAGQDTQLVFSSNKDREEDWFCSQCGTHNFKRREHCFKCSISKEDSEHYSEIGDVASNVLILMGLDALTTEETVTKILEYISSAKMNISIARDTLTHTSRGYCYVEMDTVETATHLMNILASMQPPFQIDGKPVSVHFCKQTLPEESKATNPAVKEAKWPTYGSQEGVSITKPMSETAGATALYYQQATPTPATPTPDPIKPTDLQQYAYQHYKVQPEDSRLPTQAGYQAQGALVGSTMLATAVAKGTGVVAADNEKYKAAVAQEQVQAARRLQLQQQQVQQQVQEETKKQAVAGHATTSTAAAAAAAVTTTAEEDQEALAEKARQWSEKKKRRKEEVDGEKAPEEKDGVAVIATVPTKKRRRKKQESSAETEAPVVPVYFQDGKKYPTPDVSKYVYDEASGFYFDSTIGLYYDANSQYYFDSATQKYLYWDVTTSTYLPAPEVKPEQTAAQTDTTDTTEKGEKTKEKKDKNDKNKMAKKLAKDMARWAKSMNNSKANAGKKGGARMEGGMSVIGAADAGFAMLMKKANPADTKAAVQHVLQKQTSDPGTGSSKSIIVASYGGGSDSEPEPETHPASAAVNPTAATSSSSSAASTVDALTDWAKLICLLCKRQFPSKEILVKHQQFSELHKQNMESLQHESQELGDQEEEGDTDYRYRDRAKERRQKFGVDEAPPKKKFRPPKPTIPYEEPTKEGLQEDNIGNKLLQKMGWNKGTGLGKKQQGRTDPIEVQKRTAGAGLGIKGGTYDVSATDSYRDIVKKVMRNRFEEME